MHADKTKSWPTKEYITPFRDSQYYNVIIVERRLNLMFIEDRKNKKRPPRWRRKCFQTKTRLQFSGFGFRAREDGFTFDSHRLTGIGIYQTYTIYLGTYILLYVCSRPDVIAIIIIIMVYGTLRRRAALGIRIITTTLQNTHTRADNLIEYYILTLWREWKDASGHRTAYFLRSTWIAPLHPNTVTRVS